MVRKKPCVWNSTPILRMLQVTYPAVDLDFMLSTSYILSTLLQYIWFPLMRSQGFVSFRACINLWNELDCPTLIFLKNIIVWGDYWH